MNEKWNIWTDGWVQMRLREGGSLERSLVIRIQILGECQYFVLNEPKV